MAWIAPYIWTAGHVVTAAELNAQLKDNMRYLKGLDGAATFESDLTVDNLITAGNVDGVDVSAHAADTTTAHGAVSAATASKIVIRDAEGQAAFAAPAAAGDALIKGTRVTTAELPAMTDEKIWKGTGGNVEEVDLPTAGYGRLTVKGFQFNPATGTFNANPERVNDNDTATQAGSNGVDQYAEILLPAALRITQFRQYGSVDNNGDGTWKIQYLDAGDAWQDWVTGISTRATADWSNWDSTGGDVMATAIRLVTTALDTATNQNFIRQIEVIF